MNKISVSKSENQATTLVDEKGKSIALLFGDQSEANADRLALCWNMHDDLAKSVEAAKLLIDHIFDSKNKPVKWGDTFVDWGLMNETMMKIEAGAVALKRAKGGGVA